MSKDRTQAIPAFIDLAAQQTHLGDSVEEAISAVLKHGQFVLGPEVAELERQLAAFCGAKHCVSCANGTDALLLALMAEGVGKGDAVFVPAFTFVATVEVVVLSGATPVFVDIRRDTFNMDMESLEAAIGEAKKRGLKPRCVIPVDLYGQPADYNAVSEIAKAHGMFVIGDAAQSFGASLNGRKVGTLAAYTATSFYPSKPLGGYGDGGAVFTDDDDKAVRLLALRNHGKGPGRPDFEYVGLNSRLDSIQAAILLQKLRLFPGEIPARQEKADSLQCRPRYGGRGAASDAGRHVSLGPVHHHHRGSRRSRQGLPRGRRSHSDPLYGLAQSAAAIPARAHAAGGASSGGVAGRARDQPAHASLSHRGAAGPRHRHRARRAFLAQSEPGACGRVVLR